MVRSFDVGSEEQSLADGDTVSESTAALIGDDSGSDQELVAGGLSYVAEAVHASLKLRFWTSRKQCWHISHGRVVGDFCQTPKGHWGREKIEPVDEHSDYFPDQMYDLMVRTKQWLDITSLSPPDGKFLKRFADALNTLGENADPDKDPIVVRLLFGNIIGMPADLTTLIDTLTEGLSEDANLRIWVGALRKGVSWNHSKIIAVDGTRLFTGGHNLWDGHYLQCDPVHDVSMEAEGLIAIDGHVFANQMWSFIHTHDCCCVDLLPHWLPTVLPTRVGVERWPLDASAHPPTFKSKVHPLPPLQARMQGEIPMISVGRLGRLHHALHPFTGNPADTAIAAMLEAARVSIKMSQQDFGPLTLPLEGQNIPIPGGVWPRSYFKALALAIYDHHVDVHIVLSAPHFVPGKLSPLQANYGNGWHCEDVAAEIVKSISANRPESKTEMTTSKLSQLVTDKLKVTFLRSAKGSSPVGNHAKFFMVDDLAYYVGSQNLYIADLAEWGVIVDDKAQSQEILREYWDPMWKNSYAPGDCNWNHALGRRHLTLDRDGEDSKAVSEETQKLSLAAIRASSKIPDGHHHFDPHEYAHIGVHHDVAHEILGNE